MISSSTTTLPLGWMYPLSLWLFLIGFNQSITAQVLFKYTNQTSGAGTTATNMSATALLRGGPILPALDCSGNQGFGSNGWPTTSGFNAAVFNASGWYVQFTLTPDPGYGFNITGFSARSRRENLTGTADDGPLAIRYGYSTDMGMTWTTVNPGNPLSSNLCTSTGVSRIWPSWTSLTTSNPVIFRIYGLSSGSNLTGDLFLRDIEVTGEVCANNPEIQFDQEVTYCFSSSSIDASIPYSSSNGTEYEMIIPGLAFNSGYLPLPASSLPFTIPAGTPPGAYDGTVSVRNSCGFESTVPASISVTIHSLPSASVGVEEQSGLHPDDGIICVGDKASLTATGGETYTWSTGKTTAAIQVRPDANTIYTVTVSNAEGCTISVSQTVTVDPVTDKANAGPDQSTCIDGSVNLLGEVGGTATTGSWSGGVPGGFFLDPTQPQTIYLPGNEESAILVLTTDGICPARDTVVITYGILPPLVLALASPLDAVCGDEITFDIIAQSGFTNIASLNFSINWDESQFDLMDIQTEMLDTDPIETGQASGQVAFGWFDATDPFGVTLPTGSVLASVTLKATSNVGIGSVSYNNPNFPLEATNADFCMLEIQTSGSEVSLKPIPVFCPDNFSVCLNVGPTPLVYGQPSGGEFSGTGVSGMFFDPSVAGPGTHTVTYLYTDDNNCSNSCNFIVTVQNIPEAVVSLSSSRICQGSTIELLFEENNFATGAFFDLSASVSPDLDGEGSLQLPKLSNGAFRTYQEGNNFSGNLTFSEITVTHLETGCSVTLPDVQVEVYPSPAFGFSAATTSDPGGKGDNDPETMLPSSFSVDFCQNDLLIFSNYSGGGSLGYIMSYTSSGNVMSGSGSVLPVNYGPDFTSIPPSAAASFFDDVQGGYSLSIGLYGEIEQVFIPYLDVNDNDSYDSEFDCLGDPMTLTYRIYAPPSVVITRNTPAEICSGDQVEYTFSTSSDAAVTFDLVFEENSDQDAPADLDDDNMFPPESSHTIHSGMPYVFTTTVNNAVGKFDRGRVRVLAVNLRYADTDVCLSDDVIGGNTDVFPKPVLEPVASKLHCDGTVLDLDLHLAGLPSENPATAGYPVRIDWVVTGSGLNEDGASGSTIIYNVSGAELGNNPDIQQFLSLTNPSLGTKTATFAITPRALGPYDQFDVDNCSGNTLLVEVDVIPAPRPEISGPTCTYPEAVILLTAADNVTLPAMPVSAEWSTNGSPHATLDEFGILTGVSAGSTTIFYTVTDDAGCVGAAELDVNIIEEIVFSSSYNGGAITCGEEVTIAVSVSDFCDVSTVDHQFTWDPANFEYVSSSVVTILPDFISSIIDTDAPAGSLLYFFFSEDFMSGASLPDGTTLFTYTLRAKGPGGIYNLPENVDYLEVYNSGFSQVPDILTGVSVEIKDIAIKYGPNPEVCANEDFVLLTFTELVGEVDHYDIDFDFAAEIAGMMDITSGVVDPALGFIQIPLPDGLLAGEYHGVITVGNEENGCKSQPYSITIMVDQEPPTASDPELLRLDCLAEIPPPDPAVVIDESDNCSESLLVAFEESMSFEEGIGCPNNPKVINRIYSVTDEAGNVTYVIHTIEVVDETPPAIITSGMNPWFTTGLAAVNAAIEQANETKTDGCSSADKIMVSYDVQASDTTGCQGKIVLMITDECGNETPAENATFYVTIDRLPPMVTMGMLGECYEKDETPDALYGPYANAVQAAIDATTATDDCSQQLTYSATVQGPDCAVEITVTVTDQCGRKSSVQYTTSIDSEGPNFTLPISVIENMLSGRCCSSTTDAVEAALDIAREYLAGDDCNPVSAIQLDANVIGTCSATVVVTATDYCGNATTLTFTGLRIDSEAPIFNPDPNPPTCFKTTLDLISGMVAALNASDNCEELSFTSYELTELMGPESNCARYNITLSYKDGCGNEASHTFFSLSVDGTPPVVSPLGILNYTCLDDVEAPDTGTVVASDNCGVEKIEWLSDSLPVSCPGTGQRTYRVYDCAGNYSDVVQTIIIDDKVPPTWVTPVGHLNRAPDCDNTNAIDFALTLKPQAEDNCGEVTVMLESTEPATGCGGGYIRTWRAYDNCGNSSTTAYVQNIILTDDVVPVWITGLNQLDGIVECSDEAALQAALDNNPVAEDNCSEIEYTMVKREFHPFPECVDFLFGEWVTEWVAVDNCNNKSMPFLVRIGLRDNNRPEWVTKPFELNQMVSCSDSDGLAVLQNLEPVALDACDQTLTYKKIFVQFTPSGDCPGEGTYTNTWTATDDCGNVSEPFTQVITVIDNTPPTFDPSCQLMPLNLFTTTPGDLPANCREGISLEPGQLIDYQTTWTVAGIPVPPLGNCIEDDCSPLEDIRLEVLSIEEEFVDDLQIGSEVFDCVRQITVETQLRDACGNIQEELFVFVYNIIDNTPPNISCQNNGIPELPYSCYSSVGEAQASALSVLFPCDNCTDSDQLTVKATTTGDCDALITITVQDCAGNTSMHTFHTRIDDEAPVLIKGAIDDCYPTLEDAKAAAIAATVISDNCDIREHLEITATAAGECPATITVTATDQCGNTHSVVYPDICFGIASQVLITEEAESLNVDCIDWQADLLAWLAIHGSASAPGNDIKWTYQPADPVAVLQNSQPNCDSHSKSVTVTFRATNHCGNVDETIAIFSVIDLVPPTANPIANTNLTCVQDIPSPNIALVTGESDDCGGPVSVTLFAVSDNGTGCPNSPRTVIHQYLLTDEYCNATLVNHIISVVDNVPPTFTAPANITLEITQGCFYDSSPAATGEATNLSDNCPGSVPLAYYMDVVNPGNDFQVINRITRTWYVVDACGNSAIPRVQLITVKDLQPPTIYGCPSDLDIVIPPQTSGNNQGVCSWMAGINDGAINFMDNCEGVALSYQLEGAFVGNGEGFGTIAGVVFLEGTTTVTYLVTDVAGNTVSCTFKVTVNCLTISGSIIWENDKTSGVKDATVNATNVLPTPSFMGSDVSDLVGDYEVSVPANGTYRTRPVKNINRMNGVTTADATAIKKHVNLTAPITDPYKKVCADVNRSGSIQIQDATIIEQSLLGNPNALNIFNVFWRFVPTDYIMPATAHQAVPAFPDFKDVTLSGLDVANVDFYGMKIGDVASPWANPQMLQELPPLVWMVNDQMLVEGEDVELTFTVSNFTNLASYQFALDFDPSVLKFSGFEPLSALPLNLIDNFGSYGSDYGELRHLWSIGGSTDLPDGTPVFRARFKVLQGGRKLSEELRLDNSEMECKAFNGDLIPTEVRLVFTETTSITSPSALGNLELQLMQNRPNPFVDATTIGFILPEACEAHIRILDVSGRELTSYDRKYTAGYHELEFKMENASFYGVLYCELITPQGKRTIKMMTAK